MWCMCCVCVSSGIGVYVVWECVTECVWCECRWYVCLSGCVGGVCDMCEGICVMRVVCAVCECVWRGGEHPC